MSEEPIDESLAAVLDAARCLADVPIVEAPRTTFPASVAQTVEEASVIAERTKAPCLTIFNGRTVAVFPKGYRPAETPVSAKGGL